ncbi:crossover junction endodeoxyribonuclease RuvC [Thermodesulfobacterium sp. TA1]|uniref:crossover junction endodeoxyribonuclease RuvC n=1 Tax=Thermodesulfobacterium sp. TA1 TaxID=2234087 RepID=UPI0012323DFB|nr:crossover junction endodeoxyribonuclease RuvC [Thermodesulfobacterium sp. TA1]QER41395.1 crossover junction endodeoxyribonuclease RuvC [Thermodesulfobacterium sp. TA1]
MKILGIDPGINHLGYACLEKVLQGFQVKAWGTISPPEDFSLPQKLAFIFEELKQIIITFNPDFLAVEEVFTRGSGSSTLKLSQAQAIILLLSGLYNLRVKTFNPKEIKSFLTQNGNAKKKDMMNRINLLIQQGFLSFAEKSEGIKLDSHRVDALSVALFLSFEVGGKGCFSV